MAGAILRHMSGEELLLMAMLETRRTRARVHAELDRRAREGVAVRPHPRAAAQTITLRHPSRNWITRAA
jgi:hypothetical protein